jgi:hypothetical protein
MPIADDQSQQIASLLKGKIRDKLQSYAPETISMPFHFRLLGKDRMAVFSFVHSVNTMLGQSIFEKVAEIIAAPHFDIAKAQYRFEGYVTSDAILEIEDIVTGLRNQRITANEPTEDRRMQICADLGELQPKRKAKCDFFAQKGDIEYYFELKTVKPNIDVFTAVKRKLLEWKAMRYNAAEGIAVKAFACLPYNPEAPNPYARWTLQGLFDISNELLVAEDFWDYLGGKGTYDELLDIFERTGIELRGEIDDRFSLFD